MIFDVLLERIKFLQLVVDFYFAFCSELERLNGVLAVTDVGSLKTDALQATFNTGAQAQLEKGEKITDLVDSPEHVGG